VRNIRSPIIVFASWGDNITPPQQALDWIPDLYASVDDIKLNEQTIVYCLHEKAGHLGLFVSASVARRETSELAGALDLIETLPPGLYEAIIQDTRPDMPGLEHVDGRYLIQFAPRTIADVLALDDGRKDERAFEIVERVSRINQGLYDQLVSPLVKMFSNDATAWMTRMMNPVRFERWFFSDLNPCLAWVKPMADVIRGQRQPASPDNAFVKLEQQVAARAEQALDAYRIVRDDFQERVFRAIYESKWLALLVGADPSAPARSGPQGSTWERRELAQLKRKEAELLVDKGTLVDAWARLLLYVRPDDNVADERPFNVVRHMIDELKPEALPSFSTLQAAIKRQATVLALDEERAIAALGKLAPEQAGAAALLRRRPQRDARARRGDTATGRALPPGRVPVRPRWRAAAMNPAAMSHEKYDSPDRRGDSAAAGADRGRPPRAARPRSSARSTRRSAA
jgi:hypothetical protein